MTLIKVQKQQSLRKEPLEKKETAIITDLILVYLATQKLMFF